jgi:glycosyltransferase involved in cell wall biosynthesis
MAIGSPGLTPAASSPPRLTRVSMLTSWDERCGIAEYSRGLVAALTPDVEVEVVPASFRPGSQSVYAAMGAAMNVGQVAHAQHSYAFWGGMRPRRGGFLDVLRAVRVPLAVTVHEVDQQASGAYGLPPFLEVNYKRWFNRRNLVVPRIGAWIVHTEPLREALCGLGAPADRVHVLPMPIPARREPLPPPEEARRRLGLAGRRVLTILGFLARRKGYQVAIESLARLETDYHLLCAGGEHSADGSATADWIRGLAASAGVADRVQITGYLEEDRMPEIMAASHLILAPFTSMSGSASLHLAIGYGKAVIASDLEPNCDLPCIARFQAGDPEALAETIQQLWEHPEARERLEGRAVEFAVGRGYPALAARTLEIYRDLLKAAP